MKKVIILIELIGILILIGDFLNSSILFQGELMRKEKGEGDYEENLLVTWGEDTEKLTLQVPEKTLTQKEKKEAIKQAKKEIEKSFLGENESCENVTLPLLLKEEYCQGLVQAEWSFEPMERVDSYGNIKISDLEKEGEQVTASVLLTVEDMQEVYQFSFWVMPREIRQMKDMMFYVEGLIEEVGMKQDKLTLPDKIKGEQISWKKQMDWRGLQLCILGGIGGLCCVLEREIEKKKQEEKRQRELQLDYPEIVNEFSILLGAGVGFQKGLELIVDSYLKRKKKGGKREGYEMLCMLLCQLQGGIPVIDGLTNFSRRCNRSEYRKFASLIGQNLRKGNEELVHQLEEESHQAFFQRKQIARAKGEETSTKLLIPLIGYLVLVMLVLIVPGLMQLKN